MSEITIDPHAIVHPTAKLADGVNVGPFTVIGPDVTIGEGTRIESHVIIKGPTQIGKFNHIFQFATIGEATPDLKYRGEPTTLTIGDHNVIREGVTIHRGTLHGRGDTLIGDYNLLMAYVHIGHDSVLGDRCILVNHSGLAGHVLVGDWAILSGHVLVHQYCQIGAHSFCGMGSGTAMDVPAFVMVTGAPAEARSINVEGLRRRNFSKEDINALMQAFKTVYRRGLTLEQALAKLAPEAETNPHIATFVNSLKASTRGIVR